MPDAVDELWNELEQDSDEQREGEAAHTSKSDEPWAKTSSGDAESITSD